MSDLLKQVISVKSECEKEKGWYKDAQETVELYELQKGNETSTSSDPFYNILFPNTEILLATSFSANPIPVIKPRQKKPTQEQSLIAQACEQVLAYQIDPNNFDRPSFFDNLEATVLDAILPGVGNVQVRYEAEFGPETPAVDPMSNQPLRDEAGKQIMQPGPLVKECTYPFHIAWNRFWWSPARKWEQVTWVAFGFDVPYVQLKKRYEKASKSVFDKIEQSFKDQDSAKKPEDAVCLVIQVWDKTTGKVGEFCDLCDDEWLKKPEPAPYKITGFFPCPKPLFYVRKSNSLRPTPLYRYYKKQAEELDTLTARLRKVVSAIKVRGVHSNLAPELANLLDNDLDNTFISATNPQLMMEGGGLDKHIWVWPIEKLVAVAQSLYQQRESCKQVIYELMGLGDIMRSTSAASESATAQKLKDKWGGLRLQRFKNTVQHYIRDTLRIMLEISFQKFSPETFSQIIGQPIPAEIIEKLRDSFIRGYSIDVETDSTVAVEDQIAKEEVAEFMQAFGQGMQGVAQLAEAGPTGVAAGKEILMAIIRRFRFGRTVEDAVARIEYQPPAPPEEKPEAPKGMTPEEIELEKYRIDQENATRKEVARIQADATVKAANIAASSREKAVLLKPPPPPPRGGLPAKSPRG